VAYQFGKASGPASRINSLINTLSFVLLITSTTSGLKWFLRINNHDFDLDDEDTPSHNITVHYNTSGGFNSTTNSFELTPAYYYESLVLLGIPIFIGGFFTIILVIFFSYLIYTRFLRNPLSRDNHA
jgi:hypothetical protein